MELPCSLSLTDDVKPKLVGVIDGRSALSILCSVTPLRMQKMRSHALLLGGRWLTADVYVHMLQGSEETLLLPAVNGYLRRLQYQHLHGRGPSSASGFIVEVMSLRLRARV